MRAREPVRLDPEQAARLTLELRPASASATTPAQGFRGELRTCDAVGASVRFVDGPALPLGSEARLVIGSEGLDSPLELDVRVESRNESEGARDYGLWFVRRHEVETRLLPALRALVERRGAARVQADPEEPVLVTLEAPGLPRLVAQLAWLSARGLEARIPAEEEARWVEIRHARAQIALPHRPEPLALEVELRSRRLAGRHALLGLELAGGDSPAQDEARRSLGALVELRRALLERRRAG